MGTDAPTIVTIPVRCAPKKAPCPKCGKLGRRKRTLPPRRVRTVVYKTIAYLEITCGEYQARCDCCTTFRNTPEGVLPRALYDNEVRDLVLARIIEDGMSIERALQSLRREFLLDLSTGFVYDLLRDRAAQLDLAEHRRMVLEQFSGTLCVDELHLGHFTLLLATDPIRDLPVAFALVGANDHDHMRRFLRNLKNWGLEPTTVITDGSNLYPALLAELWSEADHQLCVFHILKDINQLILEAVRRLRTGDEPAGPGRTEEEARPQGGQAAGRGGPAGPDEEGEVGLRLPAPASDRQAAGELQGRRPRGPGADALVPARVGDAAAVRRPDLLAVRHAQGLSSGELPPVRDRAGSRPSGPCPSWSRRWSSWARRSSPRSWPI